MAAGHGLGPGGVGQQAAPRLQALQVLTRTIRHHRWQRCGHSRQVHPPQAHQGLPLAGYFAHRDLDGQHLGGPGCLHGQLHLHRLDQQEQVASRHALADLNLDGDDAAVHRRGQVLLGRQRGMVQGLDSWCAGMAATGQRRGPQFVAGDRRRAVASASGQQVRCVTAHGFAAHAWVAVQNSRWRPVEQHLQSRADRDAGSHAEAGIGAANCGVSFQAVRSRARMVLADPSATLAALVWSPRAAARAGRFAKSPVAGRHLRATCTSVCRLTLVHAERFGPLEWREGSRWAGSGRHDWAGHYAKAQEQCTIWAFITHQMVNSCP